MSNLPEKLDIGDIGASESHVWNGGAHSYSFSVHCDLPGILDTDGFSPVEVAALKATVLGAFAAALNDLQRARRKP